MSKSTEKIVLLLVDFVTINLGWLVYYTLRVRSGWIAYTVEPDIWLPMLVVYAYWLLLFFFFGLYRSWYGVSRFDEFASVFKTVTFGVLCFSSSSLMMFPQDPLRIHDFSSPCTGPFC